MDSTITRPPGPRARDSRGATPTGSPRGAAWLLLLAAAPAIVSSGVQLVERIRVAENPDVSLFCDVNSTLSCSGVITAWQASALGVPNALIGIVVMTLAATTGLAAVQGSLLSRRHLAVVTGIVGFMLGFVLWYLAQTTLVLGALCLWCAICGTSTLLATAALVRLWRAAGGLSGPGGLRRWLRGWVDSGDDRWLWAAVWVGVAGTMTLVLTG